MNVILASASPRRIDILRSHGVDALVMPAGTDESLPPGAGMTEAVTMLAERKARACYAAAGSEHPGCVIIGADTIVWKNGIMGKPEDADDAFRMLSLIRGTDHYVATGVALMDTDTGSLSVLSDVTRVFCTGYSDQDILDYIATGEPFDKAGSYAIQGVFGRYIDHIEGDYENVVGLPYHRIAPLIRRYL